VAGDEVWQQMVMQVGAGSRWGAAEGGRKERMGGGAQEEGGRKWMGEMTSGPNVSWTSVEGD
jgi:hypothetical protein